MTSWRDQSFWSKVQTCTLLALIGMFTSYTDAHWIEGASSNRKRVFSRGFVVLCAIVAGIELAVLNHFYASPG
nr:hypothetical protein [Pseudomonas sp. RIT357]